MRHNDLGRTGMVVSEVGLGTSPLGGGMSEAYGHGVTTADAEVTARELLCGPITFIDTSNEYSDGASERLIGEAIAQRGGLPEGFLVATKVDPRGGWHAKEWPASRIVDSFRESTERLGLATLPLLYLHDPDRFPFDLMTAPGGPVDALLLLRDAGLAAHLGIAMGDVSQALQYLELGVFEVVLNHNNYTLLDQSAEPLIERTTQLGIGFVNAAPFASGVLAKGVTQNARYRYAPVTPAIARRVARIEEACDRFGVPLAAAALAFSTRDHRIASTLVGVSAPGRVQQLVGYSETPIPDELWTELGIPQ